MHRALVSPSPSSSPPIARDRAWFVEVWLGGVVLVQNSNNLKDALKYSSQMVSKLSPHKYYELCNFLIRLFLGFGVHFGVGGWICICDLCLILLNLLFALCGGVKI